MTISLIFWLSPVALTIHLGVKRNQSDSYKIRVACIYGALWAIALIYYFVVFFQ